jgi:hypothetical protein
MGEALVYVIASPWLVPHAVVEDGRPEGAAAGARFADYPYADDTPGLLLESRPPPSSEIAPDPADPDSADAVVDPPGAPATGARRPVAAELGLEQGIGVDEGVMRSGFHARALFPFRLGLDASWSIYREGRGASVDQLGLGREHLSFRFAESSRVHFQTGIGPQHLVDSSGWVHGFEVTWGFQAFPASPLVLAAEGSLGTIGGAFAPGLRGEIGLMLNRFEVSGGYEERWVGPVALGGPFASITAWF